VKVAFPTQEDAGTESVVYGHFGTANVFLIVDTDSGAISPAANRDLHHEHGNCRPLAALGGQAVDAVVVGGIGGGALRHLNAAGVKVYRGAEGTVAQNLALFKSGKLPEFTMNQTCAGHDGPDGCQH
jgi:predicted Fe-Mo cluster-binding NifX family protein